MTYQESFALASRLKNYVRLYDKRAWIYFIFSSETEFTINIFNNIPPYGVRHNIQYEAFSINKLPMATVYLSEDDGGEIFSYRDLNITIQFNLLSDRIIYFEGDENAPIDIKKVRQSFKKLLTKLK